MKRRLFAVLSAMCLVPKVSAQGDYRIVYNEATTALIPLIRAIYAEMGMSPTFELRPSERALAEISSGRFDADLIRVGGVEKMYPNLVRTAEPIKETELYAYVRKGAILASTTPEFLKAHTLGFARGSKLAEEFLLVKGLTAYATNSADSLFKMLTMGRFEIALVTSTQLLSLDPTMLLEAERAGPILVSNFSYHVLHRKHVDLVPKFDGIVKAMKADGRLKKLLAGGGN